MPIVDIVVPVFNEQDSLLQFHRLLASTSVPADYVKRYIYVNDGSTDRTHHLLEEIVASDKNTTVIQLSRNFGHQAALSAGLDASTGDIVVMLDGDGQHPTSLIPEMIKLHHAGYDIVQAQRLDEPGRGSHFKRLTGKYFYKLLSNVGEVSLLEGTSDFRLLSRRALNALKKLPEYHRFLRGMTVWIGFPSVVLPYKPEIRIAGETKYSIRKMIRLAGDGLFSFSLAPLRIGLLIGSVFIALAALELIYIAIIWFGGQRDQLVRGWTSLILIVTVGSAINMVLQGILGIYIGMVFREVKRRPIYLVQSKLPPDEL